MRSILLIGIMFCISTTCLAQQSVTEDANRPTVIIMVGVGGTPEYTIDFASWAFQIEQAASKSNAEVILMGTGEIQDINDHDKLKSTLEQQKKDGQSALWLIMIGHGTYDGRTAKFNLVGPDVSADELAEWLEPFSRPVAVIDAFSSSAPFLNTISAPGRIIITATKSGYELNFSRFGQYFAASLAQPEADIDKDGQTSLLESFLTASSQLAEFYIGEGRLATEHALIDDNGDGLGTPADWYRGVRPVRQAMDDAPLDGYRAHQIYLVYSDFERKIPLEERNRRDELELQVLELYDIKDTLPEEEYYSRLEKLLYEMALIYQEVENTESN